ncbi:hypothetical protein [Lactococcus lactis]|uniref:Uncharacterized protein n=1 Tax=Lactococcus lactis TaxID=1358 RepID=A0AAW5TTC6_9LACT|nr:hypothetical protein [Lactococcus lactis]MCW2280235.1 hypothetical protein [Lactococcus lactis]
MASRTRRKTESGMTYRNWDESEEKKLYELSIKGLSDSEISVIMNRSVSAIANRRYFLRERGNWGKSSEREERI